MFSKSVNNKKYAPRLIFFNEKKMRNCHNQDIQTDQEIFLDFDGINHGEKPVKASCILPDK